MTNRRFRWLNIVTALTLLLQMIAPPLLQSGKARAAAPTAPSASAAAEASAASALTLTKRDALQVDQNSNGLIEAGDTLRYTLVLSNTAAADATGVLFTDTLSADLNLVAGSVEASPLAYAQAQSTAEDTPLNLGLNAIDPDGDPLAYSYTLDPAHGSLSGTPPAVIYTPAADYYGPDHFTFQVCDTATPAYCDRATVDLTITPVNDVPVVTPATFSVPEGAPSGSSLGTVTYTDPDVGQTHAFAITAGSGIGIFAIHSVTGEIIVVNTTQIDYETTKSYDLTVEVTDNGVPAGVGTATITINVTDANDAPVLTPATFSLPENGSDGTVVGALTYTDPDVGQTHTFAITAGNTGSAFAIDANGQITVNAHAAVDFETTPTFNLTVQITDNGLPPLSDSKTVTINLTDANDAPVVTPAAFSVAEDAANGSVVGSVAYTDQDLPAQTMTFAITGGDPGGVFTINPASGQITLVDHTQLDFELTPSYALTVSVTDNGSPVRSGSATITVNVSDANDAPLVFGRTIALAENSANGVAVSTPITYTDQDTGQTYTFSITGGNTGGAFAIDPSSGQITVATSAALDFETTPTFNLTVRVTDNGAPVLFGEATVTINLSDVNDAPVVNPATFSVNENSANGTNVGTVTFSDQDLPAQNHVFAISSGNTGGAFAINSSTGQITVAASAVLNFEAIPGFNLVVTVSDDGSPVQSGSAAITIHLTNVNEAPVVDSAIFGLPENSPNGANVGSPITYADPDTTQTHTYSIVGGNASGAFAIDASSGQITVADTTQLDFETTPTFNLTVRVTDVGAPLPNLYGEAVVTINLTNANDAPAVNPATFAVDENSANGTAVGTVTYTDPDLPAQGHTFSILSGNPGGVFAINPTTGQITVASSAGLNFEATSSFSLVVQVLDDGVPPQAGTATITINLNNVNETPVVTPATFSVAENSASGTTVGTPVAYTDPDTTQTHTYSITGGNTGGAFAIDPSTGQITVATSAALDYETTPAFALTVRVTDVGAPTPNLYGEATIVVNLTNANDAPAVTPATFSVDENSANGANVGSPVAYTDQDTGQTHTFSIVGGNASGAFAINSGSGQITVADTTQLDFETTPTFNLTVRVTDVGAPLPNLYGEAAITINLNNLNEAPVVTGGSVSIAENNPNGMLVGPPVAYTDPDVGQTHTYSIQSGNTGGAFAINSGSGQITVANSAALDFETTPTFNLTVRVTDNGVPVLYGEATITVNLSNQNEAPVVTPATFSVDENSPADTNVGTVVAADQDTGQTKTYTIQSGNTGNAFKINPSTGLIQVNAGAVLDYESANKIYNLVIRVTDNGAPILYGEATITVNILNVDEAPIVTGETAQTVGNTLLRLAATDSALYGQHVFLAGNLLSNDSDPEGLALDAALNGASAGATVYVYADGSFTYSPPAGAVSDSFTYRVSDPGGHSTIATVTLSMVDMVWYVDNGAPAGGDGRSFSPFNTLAAAETASASGSTIYVYAGNGTTTNQNAGISLDANQRLIGAGVALVIPGPVNGVSNLTLAPAGSQPQIGNAAGAGVTAANANTIEIRGLNIGATGNAVDVTTSGTTGALTVSDNTIRAAGGKGVSVVSNSTGAVTLAVQNVAFNAGSGTALDVNRAAGTLLVTALSGNTFSGALGFSGINFNNVTFDADPATVPLDPVNAGGLTIGASGDPVGGDGLTITSGSGTLSAAPLAIYASGTALGMSGAALTFNAAGSATLDTTSGPALSVDSSTLSLPSNTLARAAGGPRGVNLLNANVGALDFDAASFLNGSTTAGFRVQGGSGNITYRGSITPAGGQAVNIFSRSSGTLNFSGPITANTQGVFLSSNTGTTINFSGGLALNTGANPAFSATGGGTVSVTGASNTLQTTTGAALNVDNTIIDASGLTFRSISASGAANGILLNNTGPAGGLTVTGTGAADTGGVIQNTTGSAIKLTNVTGVSLSWIRALNAGLHGVEGSGVNGFSLANSTVNGAGDAAGEDGLHFTNLSGAVAFTNATVSNSTTHNVYINNTGGAISSFSVTGSTFDSVDASLGAENFYLGLPSGSPTVSSMNISNSYFQATAPNLPTKGLYVNVQGGSHVGTTDAPLYIGLNSFSGSHQGIDLATNGDGQIFFKVDGNTLSGSGTMINTAANGAGAPVMSGRIQNNSIITFPTGYGFGINSVVEGNGSTVVYIGNNYIFDYGDSGIRTIARGGSGRLDATLTNNHVDTSNNNSLNPPWYGIDMESDTGATLCVNPTGNVVTNYGAAVGGFSYGLYQDYNGSSTYYIQSLPSPTTNPAPYLQGAPMNNGVATGWDIYSASNFEAQNCAITTVAALDSGATVASTPVSGAKVLALLIPDRYYDQLARTPAAPAAGETIHLPIGVLPAGKQVTITFDARINPALPSTTLQLFNQAQASQAGFDPILSDDPGTPAPLDPTRTLVYRIPVAPDDGYTTPEDTPLVVPAPGVLGNDSPASGYTLTASNFSTPTDGIVVGQPDGSFVYTPSLNANGQFAFTYRASDGTSQSTTAAVFITVTAVNDAPLLDASGSLKLPPILINPLTNPGVRVTQLLASGGGSPISDVDANPLQGIAVTAVDDANGKWQFSLDDGAAWADLGPVNESQARLLAADAATRVRFAPALNWAGLVDPGLTFRAWDQTSGANGGRGDAALNGGTTAFSAALETASILITNQADLGLTHSVAPASILAGQSVTYTLTISNSGPADAYGVAVTDTLPAGVSLVSASAGCALNGAAVVCAIGDLAAGAKATRTLRASVGPNASGQLLSTAQVGSPLPDLNPANNIAQATLSVADNAAYYQEDFEDPIGSEWSSQGIGTPGCGSPFLGAFGNQTVYLNLTGLPEHTQVMVVFDLNILRSWNGSETSLNGQPSDEYGPDIWRFGLDGVNRIQTTFSNWVQPSFRQSYPGGYPGASYPAHTGASKINSLCYQFRGLPMDSTYHIVRTYAHTSGALTLDFSAEGLQTGANRLDLSPEELAALGNEAWGLDNVAVYLSAGGPFPAYQVYLPVLRK